MHIKIQQVLQKKAKKNNLDLLIASTSIAENATLVSNDKIFKKLAKLELGLKYENWLED